MAPPHAPSTTESMRYACSVRFPRSPQQMSRLLRAAFRRLSRSQAATLCTAPSKPADRAYRNGVIFTAEAGVPHRSGDRDPRRQDRLRRLRQRARRLDRPLYRTGGPARRLSDARHRRRSHASAAGGHAVAEVRARLRVADRRRAAGARSEVSRRIGRGRAGQVARSGQLVSGEHAARRRHHQPCDARCIEDDAADHRALVVRPHGAREHARAAPREHHRRHERSDRRENLARRRGRTNRLARRRGVRRIRIAAAATHRRRQRRRGGGGVESNARARHHHVSRRGCRRRGSRRIRGGAQGGLADRARTFRAPYRSVAKAAILSPQSPALPPPPNNTTKARSAARPASPFATQSCFSTA